MIGSTICQILFVSLLWMGVQGGDGDKDIMQTILDANLKKPEKAATEGEYTSSDPKEDVKLIEGDIAVKRSQIIKASIKSGSDKRDEEVDDAATFARSLSNNWPGAVVNYYFRPSCNRKLINAVREAIKEYTKYTCIRFNEYQSRPKYKYTNYIEFFPGVGCYSYIGMTGGKQELSLGNNCEYKGIAMHEMMHALGFYHEQTRRDRDAHVKVNFNNIIKGKESNFKKYKEGEASTLGFGYDEKSIMHYGSKAFSKNGLPTITLLHNHHGQIGNRKGFSSGDIQQLKALYCRGPGGTVGLLQEPCLDRSSKCPIEYAKDTSNWNSNGYKFCKTNGKVCCNTCKKNGWN